MLNSGWFRLWVVIVAVALSVFFVAACFSIWGKDSCYRYVSISPKEGFVSDADMQVVESLRPESNPQEYCGRTKYSALLTLEQLAKRGVVTQIGFEWREPRGWTFTDFDALDILESDDISADTLIARVNEYVHTARLRALVPWGASIFVAAFALFTLGVGVAWVRRGFKSAQ